MQPTEATWASCERLTASNMCFLSAFTQKENHCWLYKQTDMQTDREKDQQRVLCDLSMYPTSSPLSDPYRGRRQCDTTHCIHKSSAWWAPQCQGSLWEEEEEEEEERDWNADAT